MVSEIHEQSSTEAETENVTCYAIIRTPNVSWHTVTEITESVNSDRLT